MAIEIPKAIFFHFPRTGGTWLANMLKKNFDYSHVGRKHLTPRQYTNRFETDKLKFSFVRNPIHWYISKFSSPTHIRRLLSGKQGTGANINPIFEIDAISPREPFLRWIRRNLNTNPGFLVRYHRWFYGRGYKFVDIIGQQENYKPSLKLIFRKSNQKIPFNFFETEVKLKETRDRLARKESCVYTKFLLKSMIEKEKPIFERFGYSTSIEDYDYTINNLSSGR